MKIFYKRKYPIGSFLNEDIGFEDEVPDGVDPVQVVIQLKEMCDKAHEQLCPEMYVQQDIQAVETKPDEPKDKIQSFIETINYCTSVTMLQRFKPQVDRENNQELTNAYNNKLNQLQK